MANIFGDKFFAELANSEVVKRLYDDALTKALRQTGELGEDIVKTLRLILCPLMFGGMLFDRVRGWAERISQRVPEDRRVEAPPSIIGPVVERLRWLEDDSIISEMYLELLTKSVDRKYRLQANPAFVKVIELLSPDEAQLLKLLTKDSASFLTNDAPGLLHPTPYSGPTNFTTARRSDDDKKLIMLTDDPHLIGIASKSDTSVYRITPVPNYPTSIVDSEHSDMAMQELTSPKSFLAYVRHCHTLGLLDWHIHGSPFLEGKPAPLTAWSWRISLSPYGTIFMSACLPAEESPSADQ